jgi:hypothetical protein
MATAMLPRADRARSVPSSVIAEALARGVLGVDLRRLYRAHIDAANPRGPERTAFVEGHSHQCAARKVAAAVAALEHRQPLEVANRIYNVHSAQELLEEGLSEDPLLRLFETGWSGGRATYFVREPLFMLNAPAAIIRIWAAIPPSVE